MPSIQHKESTIFITIPAYEDPFLIRTLDSAIQNARYPDRIKFAIGLQYKKMPLPDLSNYNVDIITYDVDNRPSINLIRYELLKFYNNEDYFMMVDSHMTFMKHWDEVIVEDYLRLKNITHEKIIISKQVPDFAGNCNTSPNEKTVWKLLDGDNPLDVGFFSSHLVGDMERMIVSESFFLTHYSSSHFFFTRGAYILEVGIIKAASIRSEEQIMSFIAYLNGWDIYAINFRNHVGHMDKDYRLALYGTYHPPRRSKFTFKPDEEIIIKEIDSLLINNSGTFSIKNPERSVEEFYTAIGLLDAWKTFYKTFETIEKRLEDQC